MSTPPNSYATHKPPVAGGGLFLKIEDGETVTLRICTEPYIFLSKFERGEEVKWSTLYAWLVFNVTENKAQVLDLSPTTYKQIAAYATDDDYGDPTEYNLKLAREGTGTDTVYSVIASPKKTPLTTDMMNAIRDIGDITDIKGHEHAVPLAQVADAKDLKRPDEDEFADAAPAPAPKSAKKDVVIEDLDDDGPVNLDEISF